MSLVADALTSLVLIVSGVVLTVLYARYRSINAASHLVLRTILFPFLTVQGLTTVLAYSVGWLLTGESYDITLRKKPYERR